MFQPPEMRWCMSVVRSPILTSPLSSRSEDGLCTTSSTWLSPVFWSPPWRCWASLCPRTPGRSCHWVSVRDMRGKWLALRESSSHPALDCHNMLQSFTVCRRDHHVGHYHLLLHYRRHATHHWHHTPHRWVQGSQSQCMLNICYRIYNFGIIRVQLQNSPFHR